MWTGARRAEKVAGHLGAPESTSRLVDRDNQHGHPCARPGRPTAGAAIRAGSPRRTSARYEFADAGSAVVGNRRRFGWSRCRTGCLPNCSRRVRHMASSFRCRTAGGARPSRRRRAIARSSRRHVLLVPALISGAGLFAVNYWMDLVMKHTVRALDAGEPPPVPFKRSMHRKAWVEAHIQAFLDWLNEHSVARGVAWVVFLPLYPIYKLSEFLQRRKLMFMWWVRLSRGS